MNQLEREMMGLPRSFYEADTGPIYTQFRIGEIDGTRQNLVDDDKSDRGTNYDISE